jgi:hypothetical protein
MDFESKVDEALRKIKLALSTLRVLRPGDAVHTYDDKYLLANESTTAMIYTALIAIQEFLGLSRVHLDTMIRWVHEEHEEVSIQFMSTETLTYINETMKSVENPQSIQKSSMGISSVIKSYTKITEYNYVFTAAYKLIAVKGAGLSSEFELPLLSRSMKQSIVLGSKEPIFPEKDKFEFKINLSWLFRRLHSVGEGNVVAQFEVDRSQAKCFTPTENEDIITALQFAAEVTHFADAVRGYFLDHLFQVELSYSSGAKANMDAIYQYRPIFSAIVPLFQETEGIMGVLSSASLLSYQQHEFQEKFATVMDLYKPPASDVIISASECTLEVGLHILICICSQFKDAMDSIDDLVRQHLAAAVGKVLQPEDFHKYMQFHNRRLLCEEYQPRPFSHSVRRSLTHSPEGSLLIEETAGGKASQPILTMCRSESESAPMRMALSSSSTITFGGERHLHVYLAHSFSGAAPAQLTLVAQARQFSSFILVAGTLVSATEFDPKFAVILQNKDELKIPLLLEQVPTAGEFRKATHSLSPEQQRFATAYRRMQVLSSLS